MHSVKETLSTNSGKRELILRLLTETDLKTGNVNKRVTVVVSVVQQSGRDKNIKHASLKTAYFNTIIVWLWCGSWERCIGGGSRAPSVRRTRTALHNVIVGRSEWGGDSKTDAVLPVCCSMKQHPVGRIFSFILTFEIPSERTVRHYVLENLQFFNFEIRLTSNRPTTTL